LNINRAGFHRGAAIMHPPKSTAFAAVNVPNVAPVTHC
jgi:hypothetical protein